MSHFIVTVRRSRLLAATLVAVAVAVAAPSAAQRTPSRQLDNATAEALESAIEALKDERYDAATSALAPLDRKKLSPYGRSRVEQVLFNVAYAQHQFDAAREHLERAIAAGGLNASEIAQARYQNAQLLMQQERWVEGEAAIEDWLEANPQHNPAADYLLAVARYQADDFDGALAPARAAVERMEQPQESWISLLLALYLQREQYREALPLLQQLIIVAPAKKSYWLQLSSVYGQLEDYANSSAIMQLAHNAGLLTEDSELRRFADLLLFNDQPQRAAAVLEEAIANGSVTLDDKIYEKLANSWIEAGEFDNAVQPLERATELATTGEPYVRLGQVQIQREDWTAAAVALGRGIAKGGLADANEARFLMGVAMFEQHRYAEAQAWFEQTRESPRYRDDANAYIALMASQRAAPRL